MTELTFKLAGPPIDSNPLPWIGIELTPDAGFVLTYETTHSFPSQVLEHCAIGKPIAISVGNLNTTGTVHEVIAREDYSKLVMTDLQGIT